MSTDEKLQKVLARAGYGSRRALEDIIAAGRVRVNNKVAKLGDRVLPTDHVELDGMLCTLRSPEQINTRVLVYHKPVGEVCTRSDPEGRPTIFDHLPPLKHARWVNLGRLDINTSGLLLLTNDGELAHQLTHPSRQIPRIYLARVHGTPTKAQLSALTRGVMLEDGEAKFNRLTPLENVPGDNPWFKVEVAEGRNRLVRRLFESQGLEVGRLRRIQFGAIHLPRGLAPGGFQELSPEQVASMRVK
jgi:23S rRNA pseudouridine2605 synthase